MENRPLVAEIIGPAGAGKSTLSSVLNANGNTVRAGITVWGLPAHSLITSGLLSLPNLLALSFEGRVLRRGELKQMVMLAAFRRLLRGYVDGLSSPCNALFMDEGIVFALAKPRTRLANENLARWEKKELDLWTVLLDAVIWLDAPDEVLVERIRTRGKHHRIKHEPEHRIKDFLRKYRVAYEFVISELTRRSNIRVLRFDTENSDPATLAEEVLKITGADKMPEGSSHLLTVARGIENEQTV